MVAAAVVTERIGLIIGSDTQVVTWSANSLLCTISTWFLRFGTRDISIRFVSDELVQSRPDLSAHVAGNGKLLVTGRGCGILKILVEVPASSRENRAGFSGAVAHGEDVIKLLIRELVHGLRAVPGDINADFRHCLYGIRVQTDRMRAGTKDLETITRKVPQMALGHLAAS